MLLSNISAFAKKITAAFVIAFLISFPAAPARAVDFDAGPLLEQTRIFLDQGQFLECMDAYYQVYQYSRKPKERALGLVRIADVQALVGSFTGRNIVIRIKPIEAGLADAPLSLAEKKWHLYVGRNHR